MRLVDLNQAICEQVEVERAKPNVDIENAAFARFSLRAENRAVGNMKAGGKRFLAKHIGHGCFTGGERLLAYADVENQLIENILVQEVDIACVLYD